MPSSATDSGSAPAYSAGWAIEPTPTMHAWPDMSRGTDWTVPIMPGLVMLTVVPAKSSGASFPVETFRMSSSYAAKNPAKSSVSARLMFGTRSVRVPSLRFTSTARPRSTWSCRTASGLPSGDSRKVTFMPGTRPSACTTAQPMRWVKLTFPEPCLRTR